MWRATAALILVAALGGCSSIKKGPELVDKPSGDDKAIASPAPVPARNQVALARPNPEPPPMPSLVVDSSTPLSSNVSTPKTGFSAVQSNGNGTLPVALVNKPFAPPKADKTEIIAPPLVAGPTVPVRDSTAVNVPPLPPIPDSPRPLVINQVAPAPAPVSIAPASDSTRPSPLPGHIEVKHTIAAPKEIETPGPGALPGSITALNEIRAIRASGPAVRMVNSKRITLNYELKGVGPSGVSGVELWYTRDTKTWKKSETPPQIKPPYVIEVNDEGVYGFTLLARSGVGIGKEPPKPGEQPQVWVEVDMSKPAVRLLSIDANLQQNSAPTLVVRWAASDKNLGSRPITLAYAEQEQGPWLPMASNVENTGRFVWPLPSNIPARFLVRVEAIDLPGNVGSAQTPKAILVDMAIPTVSILNVEPAKK